MRVSTLKTSTLLPGVQGDWRGWWSARRLAWDSLTAVERLHGDVKCDQYLCATPGQQPSRRSHPHWVKQHLIGRNQHGPDAMVLSFDNACIAVVYSTSICIGTTSDGINGRHLGQDRKQCLAALNDRQMRNLSSPADDAGSRCGLNFAIEVWDRGTEQAPKHGPSTGQTNLTTQILASSACQGWRPSSGALGMPVLRVFAMPVEALVHLQCNQVYDGLGLTDSSVSGVSLGPCRLRQLQSGTPQRQHGGLYLVTPHVLLSHASDTQGGRACACVRAYQTKTASAERELEP